MQSQIKTQASAGAARGMLYSTETFRRRNSVHFNCNDPETAKLIELVRGMAAADGLIVDHWSATAPATRSATATR